MRVEYLRTNIDHNARNKVKCVCSFNNTANTQGFMLESVVVPVAKSMGVGPQYEYLRPSIQRFPQGAGYPARNLLSS